MKTMTIFPKTKLIAVALMTLLSASCMRETPDLPVSSTVADRITFGVDLPFSADVDTKATEVTSLSSFNASAVTGSAGSETAVWTNAAFSDGDSDSKYTGDKYWPLTNDNPYRFYASNAALTYSAAGNTVTVDTDTDVVCAYLDSPTYKDVNTLAFEHVFARIGDMTVNAASGYTITGVSIRITPKVSGTYNLRTGSGQTDGTGWSETSDGSAVELANATPGTKSNNVFLVPGRYTLTASWTATRGEYTQTFTDRNQDVDIVGGSVSSIITTLGGLAQDLQFTVSVNAWGSNGIVEEFLPPYLTFYCDEAGTIGWQCSNASIARTIQYSKDAGATWTDLTSTTSGATVAVKAGDIVCFKGSNTEYANSSDNNQFTLSNKAHVYGNVNSLTGNNDSVSAYCFYRLFRNCSNLYTYEHKKIILPATTLADYCYANMFANCPNFTTAPVLPATSLAIRCYYGMFGLTSLQTAPELPATTLASECYLYMFRECTSLTTAPELPATTMADKCYYGMFFGCTSLSTALDLPATTLAYQCYLYMFRGCTSLTTVPEELPATTLAAQCYYGMFVDCTSLTTAPELPATTLAAQCYHAMFDGCTSLITAPELPATTLAAQCYYGMFKGCTSLTTTPDFPATTMADKCYEYMFRECTSLTTTASEFPATTLATQCYYGMFYKCTSLTTVPEELPATTLAAQCYYAMFDGCTSLTTAPELPATTLAAQCYTGMFEDCTSLTIAPELPATTMADQCYKLMFNRCASLTTASELPATTLAAQCYYGMFQECTSLTTAPELPATTLAAQCYLQMFNGCTSLTTAPELPATTLAAQCYYAMFNRCFNLNSITCLAEDISATECTKYWLSEVSSTGTFTKSPNMNSWTSGEDGIPSGWTVLTE